MQKILEREAHHKAWLIKIGKWMSGFSTSGLQIFDDEYKLY